jgi:hypothetical protein
MNGGGGSVARRTGGTAPRVRHSCCSTSRWIVVLIVIGRRAVTDPAGLCLRTTCTTWFARRLPEDYKCARKQRPVLRIGAGMDRDLKIAASRMDGVVSEGAVFRARSYHGCCPAFALIPESSCQALENSKSTRFSSSPCCPASSWRRRAKPTETFPSCNLKERLRPRCRGNVPPDECITAMPERPSQH